MRKKTPEIRVQLARSFAWQNEQKLNGIEVSRLRNIATQIWDGLKVTDEGIIKFLPLASWLSLLALISIYVSHSADKKVHRIDELSKQRQTLEAEHTETRERLTKLSLESRVVKKANTMGLKHPTERPQKIVVKK